MTRRRFTTLTVMASVFVVALTSAAPGSAMAAAAMHRTLTCQYAAYGWGGAVAAGRYQLNQGSGTCVDSASGAVVDMYVSGSGSYLSTMGSLGYQTSTGCGATGTADGAWTVLLNDGSGSALRLAIHADNTGVSTTDGSAGFLSGSGNYNDRYNTAVSVYGPIQWNTAEFHGCLSIFPSGTMTIVA